MVKAAKKPRRFARVPKTKSGVPLKYLKDLQVQHGPSGKEKYLVPKKNTRPVLYPKAQ